MKDETQKSVTKVFGWPDASWLRAMKMINRQLLVDGEGKRARNKLCEVSRVVIETSKQQATARIEANDFQIAHAFTNELLELAKFKLEVCGRRGDVVMVPRSDAIQRVLEPPSRISEPEDLLSRLESRIPPESEKKKDKKQTKKEVIEAILEPPKPVRPSLSTLTEVQEKEAVKDFIKGRTTSVKGARVPTSLMDALLAEAKMKPEPKVILPPEPVIVKKRKITAPTRAKFSLTADKLRNAAKKHANYVLRIQNAQTPIVDAEGNETFLPFSDEEDRMIDLQQQEIISELLPMLLSYDDLDAKGIELPTGNLKSTGGETNKFINAVTYASERLIVVPPNEGFPQHGFSAIEDNLARESYIEALKDADTAIKERLAT